MKLRQAYGFTNPLAIEFGFWGFLIWVFYFRNHMLFLHYRAAREDI